jgi:hypothetical protein
MADINVDELFPVQDFRDARDMQAGNDQPINNTKHLSLEDELFPVQQKDPTLWDQFKSGVGQTIAAGQANLTDDPNKLAGLVSEQDRDALPMSQAQQQILLELAPYAKQAQSEDASLFDKAGFMARVVGKFVQNPRELLGTIVQSAPNSAPGLAASLAGGAAGAATPVPGGALAGGFLGGVAGGYQVEQGSAMLERIAEGLREAKINPQDQPSVAKYIEENYSDLLSRSRAKGAVTAGTDSLFNMLTLGVAGAAERATMKAVRNVERRTDGLLTAAGRATLDGAEAANAARNTLGNKVVRGLGMTSAEAVGEGASEGLGQYAADGKVDLYDVTLEGLAGAGHGPIISAGKTVWDKVTGATTTDDITKAIGNARTLDEAIATAKAAADSSVMGADLSNLTTDLTGLQSDLTSSVRESLDENRSQLEGEQEQPTPPAVQPVTDFTISQDVLAAEAAQQDLLPAEVQDPNTMPMARDVNATTPAPIATAGQRQLMADVRALAAAGNLSSPVIADARKRFGDAAVDQQIQAARAGFSLDTLQKRDADRAATPPIVATTAENGVHHVTAETQEQATALKAAFVAAGVKMVPTNNPLAITIPKSQPVSQVQNITSRLNTMFRESSMASDLDTLSDPILSSTAPQANGTPTPQAQQARQEKPQAPVTPVTATDTRLTGLFRAKRVANLVANGVAPAEAQKQAGAISAAEVTTTDPTHGAIKALVKMFGGEVRFFRANGPSSDGFYREGNTVWVNADGGGNLLGTAFHEWKHSLKTTDKDAHDAIDAAAAKILVADPARMLKAVQKIDPKNNKGWVGEDGKLSGTFDLTTAVDETGADLTGDLFMSDPALIQDIFNGIADQYPMQKAKGIIERIKATMIQMIDKLLIALRRPGVGMKEAIGMDEAELQAFRATVINAARRAVIRSEMNKAQGKTPYQGNGLGGKTEMNSLRRADFTDPEQRSSVSTTQPTPNEKKGRSNNAITENWVIDTKDIEASQGHIDAVVAAIGQYNTVIADPASSVELLAELRKVVVANLLKLHDMVPANVRARARLWYDGANVIANDWAKQFGLSDRQVAGVLAVFSPQMDWFKNVSLAERAIVVWKKHQDTEWSADMTGWVRSYVEAAATLKDREDRLRLLEDATRLEGKPLKFMEMSDQARFIRVFDETYHERTYRLVTPEGGFGEYVTKGEEDENGDLEDASITWGSFATIEKAIHILQDGSFKNVSERLGKMHKVRNFFNNILDPNSKDGHVTIDTHAIAAALLKALSGNAREVLHNFGSSPKGEAGPGANAETGAKGTYGLFADAYREAASQRGILAREMQSITWEAIRSIFPAGQKKAMQPRVEAVWDQFKAGKIDRAEAERQVMEMSGGLRPMAWEGSSAGTPASAGGVSFDHTQRQPRSLAPANTKEKVVVSMSAYTDSIPALKRLRNLAAKGDDKAHALLQSVALDAAKEIMRGTSAKITAKPVTGLYGGATEPSLQVEIAFNHAERNLIVERLKVFADTFNQEQVHVLRKVKEKPGHQYADGSYATPVYRFDLKQSLSVKEIGKIIKSSNLYGLTFGDTFITAYYVDDATDTRSFEEKQNEFAGKINAAATALGENLAGAGRETARLWAYGDRGDGAIGWPGVSSSTSAESGVRAESVRVAKRYIDGLKQRPDAASDQLPGAGVDDGGSRPERFSETRGVSATGIHYSKQERKSLAASMFGTGLQGAELERVKEAADERLRHRIYFYTNTGKGINPEFGVGPHAHRAELDNLYDIDNDPEDLTVGADANLRESRILDAGYKGYISQAFGAAVLIGPRSVDVQYLGMGAKPDVAKAGQSEPSTYQSQLRAIAADKSLPGGEMTGARWKARLPEMDLSHLDDETKYYKSGIVKKPEVMFAEDRDLDFTDKDNMTLADMWLRLTDDADKSFIYKRTDKKDMVELLNALIPKAGAQQMDKWFDNAIEDWKRLYRVNINGKDAKVWVNDRNKTAWIDVAGLKGEGLGSQVYNAVANWAYNNDYVFVGDPYAISDAGKKRRLENLVASALKFRTTRHLAANEQMQDWFQERMGYPLDDKNLQGLLQASYDVVMKDLKDADVGGDDIIYNVKAKRYEYEDGQAVGEGVIDTIASRAREKIGAGAPGNRTLQRVFLSHTLLRGGDQGRALAEELRGGARVLDGLDRPVVYSEQRAVDVESPEFKRWFGSSKLLDDDGNPQRYYHITAQDFDAFKAGGYNDQVSGPAIWLSPHSEYQAAFHNVGKRAGEFQDDTRVLPVYVKMERPLLIDDTTSLEWARDVFAKGSKEFPQLMTKQWVDEVTKDGEYDGIVFKGTDLGWGENSDEIIVFKPTQIKSAVSNSGDYSDTDPRINFSEQRDRANIDTAVRRMGKMVDAFQAKQIDENYSQILGPTPVVLRALGAPDLDLEIDGAVLQKVLAGKHKLDITPQMMKRLPEGVYDPVMAFVKPDGDVLLLTDMGAVTGNQIMVAVHFRQQAGRMKVNRIATAHEYNYMIERLSRIAKDLRYVRNEESLAVSTTPDQPFLSDVVQKARDSGATVLNENDLVKLYGPVYAENRNALGTLTPAQQQALDRAGALAQPKSLKEKIAEWLKQDWKAGMVDQFNAIKELDPRAYMMARLSKGGDGTLRALMIYGKAFMNGDTPDVKVNDPSGGFAKVLTGLKGEHDRFLWWVAALRAEKIKERHAKAVADLAVAQASLSTMREGKRDAVRDDDMDAYRLAQKHIAELTAARDQLKAQTEINERLLSDADVAAMKTLVDGKFKDGTLRAPAFAKALKELNEYNNSVLEIARDSGLIDQDAVDLFKDQPYVPFYRVMDATVGGKFSTGLKGQEAWKRFKGSERQLKDDMLGNVLGNWSHLLNAAARNRAAVATLAAAVRMNAAKPVPSDTKGSVKVKVKGDTKAFMIDDPHLVEAISAVEYAAPSWMKPFMAPKQLLTWGVTVSPYFKIRNLIRDSISAIGQSDLGYNAFKNVADGFKLTRHDSQVYASMLAGGGVMHFAEELNDGNTNKSRREIDNKVLDRKGFAKLASQARQVFDAYQQLGERGENVNRAALYDKLRKEGKSHAEAAFMARDLLDFTMSGRWPIVRFLASTVPFLNARMQGLYKLGRAGGENPQRLAYVTGAVVMASLALLMINGDDDDWDKITDEARDTYWHVKIGGYWFKIPKPFEIGTVGTVFERTAEAAMTGEWRRWRESVLRSAAATFHFNPIPQTFKPMFDIATNKDSFTQMPIEDMSMQRLAKEDRSKDSTSMVANAIGQLPLGVSPLQADHLIKGYFGWAGGVALASADIVFRPAAGKGERPDRDVMSWVSGGMVDEIGKADSSRYVSAFYKQLKEVEEIKASYDKAVKDGDKERAAEIKEESGDLLKKYKMSAMDSNQIGYIGRQIKKLDADRDMPGEEKRAKIDALRARQAKIAAKYG